MQCAEVQEYLAERLAGSLSDRLSGTVHAHVRTHMLSCPECCEEMEDFEEMQAVLRAIPIEPCDSEAMRARFDLLIGSKEVEVKQPRIQAMRRWSLTRSARILLAATVATAVLAIAVLALLHERIGNPATNIASTVPAENPRPAVTPPTQGVPIPAPSQMPEISSRVPLEDGDEVSGSQLVTVDVTIRNETGERLPYKPDTSIIFTGAGASQVAASCVVGNLFRAAIPARETFTVSVDNVATGYSVQSIVDGNMTDLLHGGLFTVAPRVPSPSRIVVTLKKN